MSDHGSTEKKRNRNFMGKCRSGNFRNSDVDSIICQRSIWKVHRPSYPPAIELDQAGPRNSDHATPGALPQD